MPTRGVHTAALAPGLHPTVPQAFHEYQRYTLHGGHVDTYEKPALAKVWDELLDAGLVAFVDPR